MSDRPNLTYRDWAPEALTSDYQNGHYFVGGVFKEQTERIDRWKRWERRKLSIMFRAAGRGNLRHPFCDMMEHVFRHIMMFI